MSDESIRRELGSEERELADRLSSERPVPDAGFRRALESYLAVRDPGYGPRPDRLRLVVSAYLGSGSLLIVLGALEAVGAL